LDVFGKTCYLLELFLGYNYYDAVVISRAPALASLNL